MGFAASCPGGKQTQGSVRAEILFERAPRQVKGERAWQDSKRFRKAIVRVFEFISVLDWHSGARFQG